MEKHSLETWYALADVDPQGTFNKLVKSLDISFSTAEIILSDNNKDYLAACKYLIEKYQDRITKIEATNVHGVENATGILNNKGNNAWWSLFLGIFSLIAWIYPLCGFPVSIIGLILGIRNINSSKRNLAITGTIISIIGLIITTANSAIGAYLGYTGQLFTSPNTNATLNSPKVPTNIISTSTSQTSSNCFKWSEITLQMEGEEVCVYGTVIDHSENWENQLSNFYFGTREEFFIVSNYRWTENQEGNCLIATGIIQLNTYNVPYIKVEDIINYCSNP